MEERSDIAKDSHDEETIHQAFTDLSDEFEVVASHDKLSNEENKHEEDSGSTSSSDFSNLLNRYLQLTQTRYETLFQQGELNISDLEYLVVESSIHDPITADSSSHYTVSQIHANLTSKSLQTDPTSTPISIHSLKSNTNSSPSSNQNDDIVNSNSVVVTGDTTGIDGCNAGELFTSSHNTTQTHQENVSERDFLLSDSMYPHSSPLSPLVPNVMHQVLQSECKKAGIQMDDNHPQALTSAASVRDFMSFQNRVAGSYDTTETQESQFSDRISGGSSISAVSVAASAAAHASLSSAVSSPQFGDSKSIIEFSIIEADFSDLVDDYDTTIMSKLPAVVSWSFPSSKSSLNVEGIQSFCFPSGVSIDFIPKEEAADIISRWTDVRHILQFMDATDGQPTYACCLIANSGAASPSLDITKALIDVCKRKKAANLLKFHMQRFSTQRKRERWMLPNTLRHYYLTSCDGRASSGSPSHPLGSTSNISGLSTSSSTDDTASSSDATERGFLSKLFTLGQRSTRPQNTTISSVASSNSGRSSKVAKEPTATSFRSRASVAGSFSGLPFSKSTGGQKKSPQSRTMDKLSSHNVSFTLFSGRKNITGTGADQYEELKSQYSMESEQSPSPSPDLKEPSRRRTISSDSTLSNSTAVSMMASSAVDACLIPTSQTIEVVSPAKPPKPPRPPKKQPKQMQPDVDAEHAAVAVSSSPYLDSNTSTSSRNSSSIPGSGSNEAIPSPGLNTDTTSTTQSDFKIAPTASPGSALRSISGGSFTNDSELSSSIQETANEYGIYRDAVLDYIDPDDERENMMMMHMHEENIIITKKAYCLVTKTPMHAQVFQILQAVADAERGVVQLSPATGEGDSSRERIAIISENDYFDSDDHFMEFALSTHSPYPPPPIICPAFTDEHRKEFLEKISAMIRLRQNHSNFLHSGVHKKQRRKGCSGRAGSDRRRLDTITVPGYIEALTVDDGSSFPSLEEWTTAVMLTYLSTQTIIKVINLLLMEKSIIISGKEPGVVTAVSLAVTKLLVPFAWEGVFIPLVPDDVRELFDAPVPFIVGTINLPRSAEVTSTAAVLVLDDATSSDKFDRISGRQKRRQQGSPTKAFYSSWFSRLPEVNADMPVDDKLLKSISRSQHVLAKSMEAAIAAAGIQGAPGSSTNVPTSGDFQKRRTQGHSLRVGPSPDIHFSVSMSSSDRSAVSTFLETIRANNNKYFGDLCVPGQLKRFVKCHPHSSESIFQPDLFLEPLRSHVDFLEAVVHTQHFMAFVERKMEQYQVVERLATQLICDWIYARVQHFRVKKATNCLPVG